MYAEQKELLKMDKNLELFINMKIQIRIHYACNHSCRKASCDVIRQFGSSTSKFL